jgi:hypothetical protein
VRVGAVYEIETQDNQCRATTLKFLRHYEDKETAGEWIAADELRKLEDARKRSLEDAKKSNALTEALEPVRRIYLRNRSLAFELIVLRYLRTGAL